MTQIAKLIATMGGVGFLKPAPGTWGSAVSVGLMIVLHPLIGGYGVIALTGIVAITGYWATRAYTKSHSDHDPSEVVVDEWVGQWIALWSVAYGASFANVSLLDLWPGLITSFIAFRIFDIFKWGLVGKADRRGDAWGVMLDDIWAGIFALSVVTVFGILWHVIFL